MKKVLSALNWRYATKKYDASKKLSDEQLSDILEAVRLAPSSFGLLPYKIIVVNSPEVRMKLKEAGYGQPAFTDASQILVFAVDKNFGEKDVDELLAEVIKVRGVTAEMLKGYEQMMKGSVASRTSEQRAEWGARQAYLALGLLLTVAAQVGVDATPMEGFDGAAFDKILGLEEKGLKSVVSAALGFRDESDEYIKMKKVRFSKEKLFIQF